MMKNEQPGLPTFFENTPSVICDQVLWLIKNSGLNFQIKETPFSLEINLKKRFANQWNQNIQSPPHVFPQHHHETDIQQNNSEMLCQVNSLKANLDEASHHKNEAAKELFELDKVHRKLTKENKELSKKHEEVCSQLKVAKNEKEISEKGNNSLSVALKTCKKIFDESSGKFEKERHIYKLEIEKLNHLKLEKDAELKAIRKAEKKQRQKSKKEATSGKMKEDTAKEDVPIKADQVEPPRTVLKARTKDRIPKVRDISVFNPHTGDVEDLEDESLKDVEVKASETNPSTSDTANSLVSSASAPATKDDLEEVWKFFEERWNVRRDST